MAIKTILVKFTVDTETLDKVESDYKGDYQNQIRSALGWAEESGVVISEINPDPLDEFCNNEAVFRLTEYHDLTERQAARLASEIADVIRREIDYNEDLYDCIDRAIEEYLENLDVSDLITRYCDSYEVILENHDGSFDFGCQSGRLEDCIKDAEEKFASGEYAHVALDGCIIDQENIPLWYDGDWEDENKIKQSLAKSYE